MIRDNALRVSGLLSEKMGGPPSIRRNPTGFGVKPDATNRSRCRQKRGSFPSRGLVIWRRAAPYASFVNFDGPDRSSCFPKRSRTNTPLQALTLLNDQAYVEMALGFAASILRQKGVSADRDLIRMAFRRTLSREPTEKEVAILDGLLGVERKRLQANPKAAKDILSTASGLNLLSGLDEVELASWFFVANALLNLDETITKG